MISTSNSMSSHPSNTPQATLLFSGIRTRSRLTCAPAPAWHRPPSGGRDQRKSLLYSNGRCAFALMFAAMGWRGFSSATISSGTMTEGTNKIGDRLDVIQEEPILELASPAGIALQAAGKSPCCNSSRAAQTSSGTSIRISNRFMGSPASTICAAVSSTASAIFTAQ